MSTHTTVTPHWFKLLPFAVILLAVALTLGLVFANLQPAIRFGSARDVNEASSQRGIEADAARYNAMASAYIAQQGAAQRSIEANTARYNAMAEAFLAEKEASLRAIEAETARYEAMTTFYSAWINDPALSTGMAAYFRTGK